jgi:hypothetical protein
MKIVFPEELYRVLEGMDEVCLAVDTDQGVVVLIKTDHLHIPEGNVPILYQYELGVFPEGAIIRIYLEIYDRPEAPFQAQTFLNPASQADLILLQELCRQDHLDIHVVNTAFEVRYAKRVRQSPMTASELHQLVRMAVQYNSLIPDDQLDFEMVKKRHQAARHAV